MQRLTATSESRFGFIRATYFRDNPDSPSPNRLALRAAKAGRIVPASAPTQVAAAEAVAAALIEAAQEAAAVAAAAAGIRAAAAGDLRWLKAPLDLRDLKAHHAPKALRDLKAHHAPKALPDLRALRVLLAMAANPDRSSEIDCRRKGANMRVRNAIPTSIAPSSLTPSLSPGRQGGDSI